jgi:hypothetical protein
VQDTCDMYSSYVQKVKAICKYINSIFVMLTAEADNAHLHYESAYVILTNLTEENAYVSIFEFPTACGYHKYVE